MADTQWAKEYILDPLNAPAPNEETGLNSHFRSTFAPAAPVTPPNAATQKTATPTSPSHSNNPFRQSIDGQSSKSSAAVRTSEYPSPPNSASYRQDAFRSENSQRQRQSLDSPRSPKVSALQSEGITRSRGSSLGERFPGDMSGKPLDVIRRESKRAQHPPHLKRRHIPGPDLIDQLDVTALGGQYHHEGPFDVTLLARNTSFNSSPVAAVTSTNQEALKATPKENVLNAVERHHPLEGTAVIPPGEQDRFGRVYEYQEGENLMTDLGGNYKRWTEVDYKPDDYKGKGEPSFSLDRARKEKHHQTDIHSHTEGGVNGSTIEMVDQSPSSPQQRERRLSSGGAKQIPASAIASGSSGMTGAASSSGNDKRKSFEGIKRRLGSLRKKF